MPMLEPKELEQRRHKRAKLQKRKRRRFGLLPVMVLVTVIYITVVCLMPLATLQAQVEPLNLPQKPASQLPWPTYGQAALGAVGYGMLAQHGEPKPLPIASVAKVITALAVLKERPLYKNQPIPTITITADDVTTYKQYAAQDQSVVIVEAGEQLTEYQALQALLLPSANNMADVLVRWAFGSIDNYLQFANPFTQTLGMQNTHIADASGFSPQTVSTAVDLTKLAEIAMNNPIIAEIVNQPQAAIPVAGIVYNVNKLLGQDGIVGIKTGNTDEAGGCYMFSVRRTVGDGKEVILVGTVMGADTLATAIHDALPLIESSFKLFHTQDAVHSSQIVGRITQIGGKVTTITAQQNFTVLVWDNQVPKFEVKTNSLRKSVKQNDQVGTLEVKVGDMLSSVPIVASDTIASPSYGWRLRHAGGYL